ncbi:protein kinase [Kitasatospora sp. NPDC006697]|uniref:serine/threonine-protein kinase n=1 Tax=Kitasatospora sp. NPDC006697 TaxID=3364020 RepID=UPI0036A31549
MWSRGTVLGGRYTLVERIGGGAMGEVWQAEDQVLERRVAVKIVLPALLDDADFAARFRREALILASLSHPSIVDIHDYGEDEEQPTERLAYIVMELVEGRPLDAVQRERGKLPAAEALDLVAQALDALQVAHERGIVHRDLKPSNLMVTDGGLVKVTDFGIARALAGTKITTSHSVFGTALYMAPEQAEGRGIVPASDLYSIGVVAYELLTGELPFTGEAVLEIVLKHVREPAPALPAEFAEPVRAFVARALAKQPEQRYPDAAAMAAVARRAAQGIAEAEPTATVAAIAGAATVGAAGAVPTGAGDGTSTSAGPTSTAPAAPAAPVAEIATEPTVIGAAQPVWWQQRRTRTTAAILLPGVVAAGVVIGVLTHDGSAKAKQPPVALPPAAAPSSAGGTPTESAASASVSAPAPGDPTASAPANPQPAPSQNGAAAGSTSGGTRTTGTTGGTGTTGTGGGAGTSPGGKPATSGGTSGGGTSGGGTSGGSSTGGGTTGATSTGGTSGGSTASTQPSQTVTSSAPSVPAGCGGSHWSYITNVGDGLKLGFAGSLTGGSAVVMNQNTQYGWIYSQGSFDSFYPCNMSDPPLNQVALKNTLDLRSMNDFGYYFHAVSVSGGIYQVQSGAATAPDCMTDNGSGQQVTMTPCTPGNTAQQWLIPGVLG